MVVLVLLGISSVQVLSQSHHYYSTIGINVAPLFKRTLELNTEVNMSEYISAQGLMGGMYKNTQKGSLRKVYDFTSDWENSGIFVGWGMRFYPSGTPGQSGFYVGLGMVNGYFIQTAMDDELKERFKKEGYFFTVSAEAGYAIAIGQSLLIDIGLRYAETIWAAPQASKWFSVLPGVGALWNTQVVTSVKFR